jgi:Do/DeqQ family serine protease
LFLQGETNNQNLFDMKTRRYVEIIAVVIITSIVSVFAYSKFFDKPQVIYNYGNTARQVSFGDTSVRPVDFTYAAELTIHGVVHVRTKSKVETTYRNPLYEFFYGEGAITREVPVVGYGSGVIISPDGYIVTNHHVIKGAEDIIVKLNDNREFDAKLVGDDPSTDLALLKIDGKNLPFIPFGNSDALRVGEWVLAIGNPYNLTSSVTAGIVSAKARNLNIIDDNYRLESFIQTDAALNPGNSGGALVNIRGELVGINTAILSPSGSYAGNSFAIPVTIVKKVVDDLREYGAVQRAFLGVTPTDMNAEIAKQHNIGVTTGVYVSELKETGAAKNAGIKKGDVIIKINDIPIQNTSELQEQLSKYRPGDKVTVTVLSDNKEKTVTVVLKNLYGDTKITKGNELENNTVIFGAKLAEITDQDRKELGVRYGVKVVELSPGKFSKAGIEEGFVITRINNKPVTSIEDLKKILNNTRGGVYIEGIYPNGVIAYYAFGI